ncbi:MAG: DUF2252 family protein [Proteobacteria bacterium]|nr:DUF2252 family protein [Pseudomonadota bacterium]
MGSSDALDVVREIARFNAGREPERLALKLKRMRADAFAFFRGSNHLYCRRLAEDGSLPKAPAVWSCGDLHVENFGSYKGDDRLVCFDINDFDDALLAPASWDVVRVLASILVGAASMHAGAADAEALAACFVDAYASALGAGKALRIERETSTGAVRALFEAAAMRKRRAFLDERTTLAGGRRKLRIDGRRTLALDAEARKRVAAIVDSHGATTRDPRFYDVLDAARRIAGIGSLGLERCVVLVRGKGSPDGNYLLDLKLAQPPAPRRVLRDVVRQPAWPSEAHRVVAIEQRMQAVAVAFLHPIVDGRSSYVLRALQPSEDRLALDRTSLGRAQLAGAIATMGRALAWAQLRSGGRQGSAIADALIDWAAKPRWRRRSLALAHALAERTKGDWRTYAAAYDAGAFAGTFAGAR